jgi:3-methyladenine DNA glycosylase AlkD
VTPAKDLTNNAFAPQGEALRMMVLDRLMELREEEYKKFTAALIPGIDLDKMLGVRVPAIRKLAATVLKEDPLTLQHYMKWFGQAGRDECYYEEKQLWGILLGKAAMTDEERMAHYDAFVPFIDNWAVCDIACGQLAAAKKNPEAWLEYFLAYVRRETEFEIRFGVVMLLANFIDEEHIDRVLSALSKVSHPAYYVTMGVGWTLAACYVRFPQKTEALLVEGILTKDVQNKTIQKIRESNSVSKAEKEHMKGYKIK